MGATFDGFSIREYTSKMRSIDVFKCWPFTSTTNREVTREEVQSWLPPMTLCPRSNHHDAQNHANHPSAEEVSRTDDDYCSEESPKSDDFASPSPSLSLSPAAPPTAVVADDDEKLEMVCPVCRKFNAATLTAVNAHIDGCLAQTVREERRHMRMMNSKASKSRPPKKRSIAEIFKVEDEEEEQEEVEERPQQTESVLKLWPFRDDTDDDVSITVRKFQWLSRRLEALRSRRGGGESVKSGERDSAEEEKMEMVCPVCRDFNAATVTAVNAHIDSCLAQAVRDERRQNRRTCPKPKAKAPKKRSIAEILTVAPPIEAIKSKSKAIEVEEEEEEDSCSDYCGEDSSAAAGTVVSTIKSKKSANKDRKKKKTKKAKKKKNSKLEKHGDSGFYLNNEKKTVVSKKKKKKKKKNIFNNELTGKESSCKDVVQTAVNSCRKLEGTTGNKMVALQDIDPSFRRKKLGLNGLSVERKQKVSNCDSIGKRQKAVSPVRSILKNHIKHVSRKTSNGCNIRECTEESHEKNQALTSDIDVKFSGKDDIVGPKKRDSFDETMFSISSDTLATSSVKEQSSGSDEETASLEANRNYDHFAIDIDGDKRKEVYPIVESKQFSNTLEQVTVQTSLKPCINQEKSRHLEQKSELLTKISVYDNNNSPHFDGGNTTTLHFSPYADISKPLSAVQEGQMSGTNSQVCESGVFSSSEKFIDHLEDPTFHVDAVNKNANTKTFLGPSSSYSAPYNKVNEKSESPLQTYGDIDNSGQAFSDRQLSNMFHADMSDKSYPFTSWGKGTLRNSCLDPNFFGLPLNSHGELINFSSSGKVGMNQPETSSPLRGSLSGLPINNILSQENLSINERYVVPKTLPKDGLNSFPRYPPRLSVTELCSEREDIYRSNSEMCSSQYIQPLNSELLKQNSCIEQNQCDRVQNHNGNRMASLKEGSDHISPCSSQPTVRLMGKDVPIGRSSQEMHHFTGDVWTDEESRRRHYAEYTALESSLLGKYTKQHWVSGPPLQRSTESVLQSAKIQSTQGLQSPTKLVNSTDSGFPQQFINPQSNHVSHNGSLGVGRNISSYLSPSTQESTPYAVFNGTPDNFPEQFIAGAKPLGLSSRPQVLPSPCNFSQPTCSRNGELNDRNKNPHVTKSAFGFPFLQPAINEEAKASWFQRPYRSLPTWLSSSTDEMLTGTFSQQFSGIGNQSFPQNRWGNNFITPSVNHSAEVLFPSNPLTSRGPMKTTPLCPASIVQPLQVPVTPSTINSSYRNVNKVVDRIKLDDMVVKGHHPCTNTRKRPAANLDDSRKPIRLSNIEVKENLSRMTRLTGENSSVELQRNKRAVVLDPQVDSARSRCCQNEAQNLNPPSYPAVDSFKLDGMVRPGPVRLGPKRAKHILKSS